ncbi:MAG TPA: ISL3 family transposase [Gemmataceae bacterium]|nr:ISL3 family transposase [Gemmataceae bacterium]
MSTSLLYHAFGVHGYQHVGSAFEGGQVLFKICQEPKHWRCPACDSRDVIGRGVVKRRFRTLPIGGRPVSLVLPVQRVGCRACGLVRQVKLGFADPDRSYTRAFARYALELLHHMTIKAVAAHLNVSWDVIKDIQKRDLQRRFAKPELSELRQIAIDEICIGNASRYLTVVLDLVSGAVVFVGDGKGAAALDPFWRRLRRSGAEIEAVAIDMSAAYIWAVTTHLPWAVLVFDHFHIIKLLNEKLSDLRRELYHQAATELDQHILQGTRWLLLKNPENLDPERNEWQRLAKALQLNQPLATAYYLKEDLRRLWAQPDKAAATLFLAGWIARAEASGIRTLRSFAETLQRHEEGILAYYDYRISTGPLEGTNNKIRTMQRQAYGYRDPEFFMLKILALHQAKYALIG